MNKNKSTMDYVLTPFQFTTKEMEFFELDETESRDFMDFLKLSRGDLGQNELSGNEEIVN